MCIYIYIHLYPASLPPRHPPGFGVIYIYIYIYIYHLVGQFQGGADTYIYIYIYIYNIYVYIYICVCVYVCVCIYIYVYIYLYKYIFPPLYRLRRLNANIITSSAGFKEERMAAARARREEGKQTKAGGAADTQTGERPVRPPKQLELPGGLFVQICVHFGLKPGPRSFGMLQELKESFERGEMEAQLPYTYYLGVLEETHGSPPPRPVEAMGLGSGVQ